MKKRLLILMGMLSLWLLPFSAFCCFEFASMNVAALDGCTYRISWTYLECSAGTYYIEYSTDGTNFNVIGQMSGDGMGNQSKSYIYDDAYAFNGANVGVYYRIVFISSSSGSSYFSSQSLVHPTGPSCSLNSVTRCNGLPSNLSISGPSTLCNPSQGSFTLSSSMPVIWTLGSSALTSSVSLNSPQSTLFLNNSGQDGQTTTLSANVLGCRTITKTIGVGVLPNFFYSLSANQPNFCINAFGNTVSINPGSFPYPDLSFEWGDIDVNVPPPATVVNANGTVIQDFTFDHAAFYEIYARARNSCGYFQGSIATLNVYAQDCSGGGPGGLSAQPKNISGTAGKPDVSNNLLSVFPNPAANIVAIQLPDSLDLSRLSLRLLDVTGKMVQRVTPVSHLLMVDVSGLARGMYVLTIDDGKKIVTKKIVRQ
jgi:hypothetical protein